MMTMVARRYVSSGMVLAFVVLLVLSSCISTGRNAASVEIRLEQPAFTASDCIIEHEGYVVCYNDRLLIPNWVAWELTADESNGRFPRSQGFDADPDWRGMQAGDSDYRGSGWSRGHMAPAGDMKWSEQSMRESFYLTNVCPQNAELNDGSWKWVEEKCRELARRYDRVWICCGPVVNDGCKTIGSSGVAVPDAFFKVVLMETEEGYEGIGFVFRNTGERQMARDCCMSVDEVERITGLDFFPTLKDDVEKMVEEKYDWKVFGK